MIMKMIMKMIPYNERSQFTCMVADIRPQESATHHQCFVQELGSFLEILRVIFKPISTHTQK